ncbi:hypothetical protein Y032_0002g577 [Ancylostoma ceylanicum]|uniref:Uncharacterized protein n=1 Tax=Ancylostoma ceylanicum TaxID=53326 RepID=A0A016W273_9BILA|nr:hypothetical protein Y032_0002g577 [Ancylostoma ceylanicum]
MKMLHWMAEVTRYDHICKEDIQHRFGIATMADKLREARLRWYGHVLRADNATVCKIALNIDVQGGKKDARSSDGSTPSTPT